MTVQRDPLPVAAPALRINGPAALVDAIPYLLGFHPRDSLVLVGLRAEELLVTVRIDLTDLARPATLQDAVLAVARGGATTAVAVIYADMPMPAAGELPHRDVMETVRARAADVGCSVVDMLLVACRRWWSYTCRTTSCCPQRGRPLETGTSVVSAAATYAGLVALPDRAALAATLDPEPACQRAGLLGCIERFEHEEVQAALDGGSSRHEDAVKRALFAAARAQRGSGACPSTVTEPGERPTVLTDERAARFAVALSGTRIRDSLWVAIDNGRLDGRPLWQMLARRLPSPYDSPALFLFGWCSWRAGNGALAGIAAERAIASDPGYSAADLLLAAIAHGVDPRQLPRLRMPRAH